MYVFLYICVYVFVHVYLYVLCMYMCMCMHIFIRFQNMLEPIPGTKHFPLSFRPAFQNIQGMKYSTTEQRTLRKSGPEWQICCWRSVGLASFTGCHDCSAKMCEGLRLLHMSHTQTNIYTYNTCT